MRRPERADAGAPAGGSAPDPVAVLGAGSWGTALATSLAANRQTVTLWGRDQHLIVALVTHRENRRYLPGVRLVEAILPVADIRKALTGARAVFFAVPSSALRDVATLAAPLIPAEAILVSAGKGLEDGTGLTGSQVIGQVISGSSTRLVALSGPNLAVEVAQGMPTATVAASAGADIARAAQDLFRGQAAFRVYTSPDVIGVELGGALKNVIAIGAGVSDGVGYGDNSKAALMTRGLAEVSRLGIALGAVPETFMGLAGVGDLMATGASKLSRNYRVGYGVAGGRSLEQVLAELGQVAEGVPTTRALHLLATRAGVEMPICAALYSLLFERRAATDVIRELLLRPPRHEAPLG